MEIVFYKNNSEPERMTKTLSDALTLNGTLRDETNVINPAVLIEGNIDGFTDTYNYAYIPAFNRYYYVGDASSFRNTMMFIPLHVDVLMSFKDSILNNVAIIDKQTTDGNVYINDGSWIREAREFYTIKTFTNGFNNNGEYILITAGA